MTIIIGMNYMNNYMKKMDNWENELEAWALIDQL